jgi:hypothetical protein
MSSGMSIGTGLGLDRLTGRGGWTPLALGSSLLAWWTADRADLITLSGAAVTSWKDVTHGYDAVQAVSAARPIFSATGFNGAPGLTFDGTDDYLELASQPFPSGAAGSEIWAVVQQSSPAGETIPRILLAYGGDSPTTQRRMGRFVVSGVNRLTTETGTGSGGPSNTLSTVDFSGRKMVRCIYGPATTTPQLDGVAGAGVSAVPTTATAKFRIGSTANAIPSNYWRGQIRDAIVTDLLTTDQATSIQAYLMNRRML